MKEAKSSEKANLTFKFLSFLNFYIERIFNSHIDV